MFDLTVSSSSFKSDWSASVTDVQSSSLLPCRSSCPRLSPSSRLQRRTTWLAASPLFVLVLCLPHCSGSPSKSYFGFFPSPIFALWDLSFSSRSACLVTSIACICDAISRFSASGTSTWVCWIPGSLSPCVASLGFASCIHHLHVSLNSRTGPLIFRPLFFPCVPGHPDSIYPLNCRMQMGIEIRVKNNKQQISISF